MMQQNFRRVFGTKNPLFPFPWEGGLVESLAVRCLGHCYQLHAKTMGLPLQGEKLALLPLALKFGGAPVHPALALGDQSIVEAG